MILRVIGAVSTFHALVVHVQRCTCWLPIPSLASVVRTSLGVRPRRRLPNQPVGVLALVGSAGRWGTGRSMRGRYWATQTWLRYRRAGYPAQTCA
jgi:hypothetical protein